MGCSNSAEPPPADWVGQWIGGNEKYSLTLLIFKNGTGKVSKHYGSYKNKIDRATFSGLDGDTLRARCGIHWISLKVDRRPWKDESGQWKAEVDGFTISKVASL